jgi:hypothetical protein
MIQSVVNLGCGLDENGHLWLIYLVKMVVFYSYVSHNQSYGHLPVMTGYKWDYTFHRWGYKYLYLVKGHNCIKPGSFWDEFRTVRFGEF